MHLFIHDVNVYFSLYFIFFKQAFALSPKFYLIYIRCALVASLLQNGPGDLGIVHIHLAAVSLEID